MSLLRSPLTTRSPHDGAGRATSAQPGPRAFGLATLSLLAACTGLFGSSPATPLGGGDGPGDGRNPGGGAGDPSESDGGAGGNDPTRPIVPGAATLPRLTVEQYHNAITRLFGPGITVPTLQTDDRPSFYAVIGGATQPLTETGVSLFWEAGKSIAEQVAADAALRTTLMPCATEPAVDDGCIAGFLRTTAPRIVRRPLSAEEAARYATVIRDSADGNLWQGFRFGLTALLSSPAFLYRHERTIEESDAPGGRAYDDYALASRLSFLLVNDGPDDELLQSATDGKLRDPDVLAAHLDRLYPAALTTGFRTFFEEYLDLEAAGQLDFEGSNPAQDRALATAMREEVLHLAADATAPGADFRQLFTTRTTYLNAPLAALYGIDGVVGNELVKVTMPESARRRGLLTTGAFMTADAAQDRTKPTNRGLYVQFRLMCTAIPDPPDNIPPLEDTGADPTATSVRAVLELHRSDPSCAACHNAVDPIGIGMEDFDQFGRYRSTYKDGSPVDSKSEWNGTPFDGAAELGALLAEDARVSTCMTKQLFRYAHARLESPVGELPLISKLASQFVDSGYEFKTLLQALISSESFLYASPEAESTP